MASQAAWQESMRSVTIGTALPAQALNSLFSFKHIRYAVLRRTGIDDYMLERLAKAWPMLEHLTLEDNPTLVQAPVQAATLHSLVSFSKYTFHLSYLELRLDAGEIPPFIDGSKTSQAALAAEETPSRKRLLLKVDMFSYIGDPAGVAEFLLSLFPRVALCVPNHMSFPSERFRWTRAAQIIAERLEAPPLVAGSSANAQNSALTCLIYLFPLRMMLN